MRLLPSLGHRALAAFSVLCCQRQGPWLLPLEAVLPCPAGCKTGGWKHGQRAQNMQILYPSLSQSLAGLGGKPAPDTEVLSIFVSPAAQVRHSDALTATASVSEAASLSVNTIPGELPGQWLAPSGHCHFSLLWEHSTRPARLSVRPSGATEVRV